MAQDYNSTINLPKTEFPMRASLPQREPDFLKNWAKEGVYKKIMELNASKPLFILHDGPPYANGDIHMGHALNKILKDFIVRYKNMSGFKAPFVPGWDTHGLPIERQVIKAYGINRDKVSVTEFRQKCQEFAYKHVENQREQFKRLGCLADWENPYITLTHDFESKQIEVFGEMAKRGYIYKGLKPVYWCPHDETALAEAEIEYQDSKCKSIYVKFALKDDKGKIKNVVGTCDDVYFVIWTTTTWTLPGNVAISVNPNFEYSLVKIPTGEILVLAKELIGSVLKAAGVAGHEILGTVAGKDLEYMTARHPFIDRESLVIVGDHVTLDAGTGCVHTAPGHGAEDFLVCQNYDLPVIVPVDDKGYMTSCAEKYEGMYYEKINAPIIDQLKSDGLLFAIEEIEHTYPHCWRCKDPIIFRATEQWFCSIDALKDTAIDACRDISWIPSWGQERMISMIRERNDWCISRQRVWGLPIPIFYCKDCGKEIINDETIKIVADLFRRRGSNAWYEMAADEILHGSIECSCGCHEFTKESDIMDVWFDSGSTHAAVLDVREDLSFPADLYLEGGDQYRGWFQSSMLTSIATRGVAPYRAVLTHGWTVDEDARKMSKSLGNGVKPLDLIRDFGADVLRLWVSSADYRQDMRISKEVFKHITQSYLKIRNTARYILGNVSDFDLKNMVEYDDMQEFDRYALMRLNAVTEKVLKAYDNYEYHVVTHAIHNFCVVDMSNFYLDVIKDSLYCDAVDSIKRRSCQSAMYIILDTLVRLISPILCFTADEIWQTMPHLKSHNVRNIVYNTMSECNEKYNFIGEYARRWEKITAIRDDVNRALEQARAEKLIGKPLEAKVEIYTDNATKDILQSVDLASILIVSGVEFKDGDIPSGAVRAERFEGAVKINKADGEKCQRCWTYSQTVGGDESCPTLCQRCAKVVKE